MRISQYFIVFMKFSNLRIDENPTTIPLNLLWQLVGYKKRNNYPNINYLQDNLKKKSFFLQHYRPFFRHRKYKRLNLFRK